MSSLHTLILRQAKLELAHTQRDFGLHRSPYICNAVSYAALVLARQEKEEQRRPYFLASSEILRDVVDLLGDDARVKPTLAVTYEGWLLKHGYLEREQIKDRFEEWDPHLFECLQRARLRWIDWLIERWELR